MDIEKAVHRVGKKTGASSLPLRKKPLAGQKFILKQYNNINNNNWYIIGTVKAGLKISFRPSELTQTTDKTVIQQIRGALAKQGAKSRPVSSNNSV